MLPKDWFEQIRKVYPRRTGGQGWGYVKRRIPELVKQGYPFAELLDGAKRYGDFCRATNEKYVRMARTFYGPDEWWLEDYELPESQQPRKQWEPATVSDEQRRRDQEAFEAQIKRFRGE